MIMLLVGIASFVLFGEDETDDGTQNNTNQVLCRDVNCGSHLVNDDSQRNTITKIENATHVCCVEKQDENESSDDDDDEDDEDDEDNSALGFTISLVLLITMVAFVGFGLHRLMKSPRKVEEVSTGESGEGGLKPATGSEILSTVPQPSTENPAATGNSDNLAPSDLGGPKYIPGFRILPDATEASGVAASVARLASSIQSGFASTWAVAASNIPTPSKLTELVEKIAEDKTNTIAKTVEETVKETAGNGLKFAHEEIGEITAKGMGLVLKISLVIGILIIMILIGVTVFQGQAYFSS